VLEESSGSVLKFAHYGLLTPDGKQFSIVDLRDFLRRYGAVYQSEVSPFIRGDMPPELLPEVPDLEVLAGLFEKRTEVEVLLRRAVLLYLGVQHNWDNLRIARAMQKGIPPRKERGGRPEDLFVGRTPQQVINDLYTIDLKTIILTNWEIFGPLFGGNRARFEMNMDTLNRARRIDAHAKPIVAAEVEEILNSYSWIRARLHSIPQL
jgi:hypothetical protein